METKTVNEEQLVGIKSGNIRNGWAAVFAKYVEEGEDEMLLPDWVDSELDSF